MKIEIQNLGKKAVIRISGPIDEHSSFKTKEIARTLAVEVDLSDLKSINSTGLRLFKEWIHAIDNEVLNFSRCPTFFIAQINVSPDLIPTRANVMSFYVPYFSQKLNEEKMELFETDKHAILKGDRVELCPPEVLDSEGHPMEMDVVVDKFFDFMKI